MRIALIIPVYNAGPHLDRLLPAILGQTLKVDDWLVIDSQSQDDSAQRFHEAGARVVGIRAQDFNHGGTRRLASELVSADVLFYMTQDAIPASDDCFRRMVDALLADDNVGVVYGRQLPHPGAGVLAAHARRFNYPAQSRVKSLADAVNMGIKTCFTSDSFVVYRREALTEAGGFPQDAIGSEDAYVAGQMLLQGWHVVYEASAMVYHSHEYTVLEEFKRYFDIGVFYGRETWIAERFGTAGREGLRFVQSEFIALCEAGQYWRIPEVFVRSGLKWIGYRLGYHERFLPQYVKRRISMFGRYWK